jgi:membrane-associated phospholipid phosphatase
MTVLTELGDLAVLLPLAGLMLLWLLTLQPRSGAAWWATAVMLCLGLTVLSKIYFFACSPYQDLVSPSGHTSFSMLVYGSIALIVAAAGSGWLRGATLGAGTALIAGIADSRLILGAHSLPEIAVGMAIGFAALAVFAWGYLRRRPARVPLRPLVLAAGLLVAFLHGHELRAEEMLHAISTYLHIGSVFCR